jgi:polyhydroxyalkanoate synthase subunit PhaC
MTPSVRPGPRPLPMHLLLAVAGTLGSRGALASWKSGSPGLRPPPGVPHLLDALAAFPADAVDAAVAQAAAARLAAMLDGIERYRRYPWHRDLVDPTPMWTEGGSRLLPFGTGTGVPVLLVPSLVNRSTVLDLDHGSSLVRHLARRGLDPYLLDWGAPGEMERSFTLTHYVAGRLARALGAVRRARPDRRPVVLGYCMGGLLAVALAQIRPGDVAALALLATPWDFHAADAAAARRLGGIADALRPMLQVWGELPVDHIQALFASVDPMQVPRKFAKWGAAPPDPAADRAFVATEDWLNDGVPMAGAVAIECLAGWYGANSPAGGAWCIDGQAVRPDLLPHPALVVVPANDRIVPPASALALARALPGASVRRPRLGHIGMVVGRRAPRAVWAPLARWLSAAPV